MPARASLPGMTTMEPTGTDATLLPLVRGAAGGDVSALEHLLALVHVHVTRYCRAWLSREPEEVVQDVAQECLVRVAGELGSCRAEADAEFLAWCRTIARNSGLDLLRARKREREARVLFGERSGAADRRTSDAGPGRTAVRLLMEALAPALNAESETTHALLWHRLVQHDTWAASAEALQLSRSGARRRFERTILRLRRGMRRALARLPQAERNLVGEFLNDRD